MNEHSGVQDALVVAWVALSAIGAYGCLAYSIAQTHGNDLLSLVNRIKELGV